jgi:hypothetical protein
MESFFDILEYNEYRYSRFKCTNLAIGNQTKKKKKWKTKNVPLISAQFYDNAISIFVYVLLAIPTHPNEAASVRHSSCQR